jgi:hypothetical protein
MGELLLGEQTMCKNMFTILAPACLAAQKGRCLGMPPR